MRISGAARLLLWVAVLGSTAGCDTAPRSRASLAKEAACRQRADQVFLQQNRGAIYSEDQYIGNARSAPFAANGVPGNLGAGLPQRYGRDQVLDNCLNASGGTDSGAPTPLGTAPTPPPATP